MSLAKKNPGHRSCYIQGLVPQVIISLASLVQYCTLDSTAIVVLHLQSNEFIRISIALMTMTMTATKQTGYSSMV